MEPAFLALAASALLLLAAITFFFTSGARERANVSTALHGEAAAKRVKPWPQYTLSDVKPVSHNTKLLRFSLPSPSDTLQLPPGRHMMLRATVGGERVIRPYTPTSHPQEKGHFDLVVKVRRGNCGMPPFRGPCAGCFPPRRVPTAPLTRRWQSYALGKMSQHLHSLSVGDTVEAKGPVGRLRYEADAQDVMVMLAAGSGITPMLQLMRHGVEDSNDDTRFELFFQNREERDVLLRDDLDALVDEAPDQARVWYALSRAPEDWEQRVPTTHIAGYISKGHLSAAIAGVDPDRVRVLVCGPGGFNDSVVALCKDLHVPEARIFVL